VRISVLSVASEAVPLVKTGGLADVVGALPSAVSAHGIELTTLLPGYPTVLQAAKRTKVLHSYEDLLGQPARILQSKLGQHPLLILDAPGFFAREGGPYVDAAGKDWPDNWRRFAALGRVAADLASEKIVGRRFELLHAHDWQAAMALAYLRFDAGGGGEAVPSVMTIHNMAFQGYFPRDVFSSLGLPKVAWSMTGVEYHGGVGFLKAGLEAATAITTVSPSYAQEIRTPEFGMGLEGLIVSRGNRVRGIVNGIDHNEWDAARDPRLAVNFSVNSLAQRAGNKRALESQFDLEPGDGPLFIVVSRLTWQKGMDVLVDVLDHLVCIGGRLALLGAGDDAIVAGLEKAARRHRGKIGLRIGYDEALAHCMQGGGDAILIPSRFEPCGLTQLYGLAYGCVPVVARTGGLADTIVDANLASLEAGCATGLQFSGITYDSLAAAVSRAVTIYQQRDTWQAMQRNGMQADFSWKKSGKAYATLYRELVAATS
jgi:starch synthase